MNKEQRFTNNFNGKKIVIEYGSLASLATSSILVRYEESTVLSIVSFNEEPSTLDFFPLTVVFQEKLYSVGKIPGGFFKREGKPSEYATLASRLIDRPLRPLFPNNFNHEIQVINNVWAVDSNADVRMAALLGSSLALCISKIPFNGPVAGVIIGKINGELICNPTSQQLEQSSLELIVAGTKASINMVEASGQEISEEEMLIAIAMAHIEIKKLVAFQEEIINIIGQEKLPIIELEFDNKLVSTITSQYEPQIISALNIKTKQEQKKALKDVYNALFAVYDNQQYVNELEKKMIIKQIRAIYQTLLKKLVRDFIINKKIRLDGRVSNEIRPLTSIIDVLPIVHGSALFTRGETQVLSIVTLGALGEHQIIDGLTEEESKRFMLHYNFPSFSVGETGRFGPPNRREIGHGALAEKALLQVLPSIDDFPYTIRVVTEVLASNGSTSQAAICASSLALMASGVPLKSSVAGIAMGLIKEGNNYVILSDIQGSEDHFGDMDFKVSGTNQGICALQMDIKIDGITMEIFKEALLQAKIGRKHILDNMKQTINISRNKVNKNAPKIKQLQIPINRIRDVIGAGGKVITNIVETSGNVKIDINDQGKVTIYHKDEASILMAEKLIKDIIEPVIIGEIIMGTVVRIEKFGYFINLKENIDGLLHNSKIPKNTPLLKLKQEVTVKVISIDEKNRVNLELINETRIKIE
ncbi:polyribonucleotide nucleotidyltransferase [Spiroplasma endosymbiont of Nephrotoma flavescens]|uniref:polyribonucleotide nucleotidyltransferase n=1 Tax=Spiroplasma endosymbiont of Nephrotoma flavescens TaxID=3066302 RepID=UPI00313EBEB4